MASKKFSYRLTRGGLAFAGLSVLATLGAFNAGVNTSYLLASLLIATGLIGTIMTLWNLLGLRCRRVMDQAVYAGEPFDVTFHVSNTRSPSSQLLLVEGAGATEMPNPQAPERALIWRVPAKGSATASCKSGPLERGVHPQPQTRLSSTFPFGFAECMRIFPSPGEVVVYPARGLLSRRMTSTLTSHSIQSEHPARVGLTSNEFHRLREYQPGDSLRRIHWRASAHLGKLCVREMERASGARLLVLLDSRVPRSILTVAGRSRAAAALELAISCAAEICRTALESGNSISLGGLFPEPRLIALTNAPGDPRSDAPRQRYLELLDALARLRPSDDETANALIEAVEAGSRAPAEQVFVITPTEETAAGIPASLGGSAVTPLIASDPSFEDTFVLLSRREDVT